MDCDVESVEPMKPPPLESTPFKMVEEVKDLKELAAKLRSANEIAVSICFCTVPVVALVFVFFLADSPGFSKMFFCLKLIVFTNVTTARSGKPL